jgi:DinB superfamily
MSGDPTVIQKAIEKALSGKGAHVSTRNLFDGLDWKLAGARPEGAPHSIFELMSHMIYWQNWVVAWLDGGKPPIPRHAAASWPKKSAPASRQEWLTAVKGFRSSLEGLEQRSRTKDLVARRGKDTRLGMLHTIASHNSYHGGQAVFLRQMLSAWPPPSGGLTW